LPYTIASHANVGAVVGVVEGAVDGVPVGPVCVGAGVVGTPVGDCDGALVATHAIPLFDQL